MNFSNIFNTLKNNTKVANKSNKSFTMMAFATGKDTTKESSTFTRYTGIGTCKILAVNPNAAKIKELMGFEPSAEPVYVGEQEGVAYARITFVVATVPEKNNGIELTQMVTFYLRNQYMKGSQSGKYKVIDEFGRTAWGTKEDVQAKKPIMYANGPANVTTNYRPCYSGEEELTEFFKAYLGIPNCANYVNGAWVMKTGEDLKLCEARFEAIEKCFKGDFKEVTDAIALQPENYVKLLFGVRTNDEGHIYQDVYPTGISARSNSYTRIQRDIEDRQANGGLSNRTYTFGELQEYKEQPSTYEQVTPETDPFANAANTPWG